MRRTRSIATLTVACILLAASCGPRKGVKTPRGVPPLELTDLVVHGEAVVAQTSMDVLTQSPITSILLTGLEQEMVQKVPQLGLAFQETQRRPLQDADGIIITGRGLDENSGLMAVGVSYKQDVDWFDTFVEVFHEGEMEPGTLRDLDGGGRLGVLARNTQLSWGTDLTAAVCALQLSERIVAYVAAPDAGDCAVWASWVLGRREGDEDLLERLGAVPFDGEGEPPLSVYVDGEELQNLCCAPKGMSAQFQGVDEAWLGMDPGAPARISLSASFSDPQMAQQRRDQMASLLDKYAPFIAQMSPGLASVVESLELLVEGNMLIFSITIDTPYVEALAEMLSTMI